MLSARPSVCLADEGINSREATSDIRASSYTSIFPARRTFGPHAKMSLPLSVLLCLSIVQLCVGDKPVEEIITTRNVPLLGGWFEKNTESAEIQEAAEYALKMFNSQSNGNRLFKLVSVTSAKAQVTSLLNFRIEGILQKTKCHKAENHDLNSCILKKKQLKCIFDLTFDPRDKKHEVKRRKCQKIVPKV